jgi:ABC-2 type transport system ATP-binding protein
MLKVENISKSFGEFKAINNLSFEVQIGDVMGFLGPNGAGKTTSMRVITGYLKSDIGNIFIDNKNFEDDPIQAKSMIGYLPEGVPLYLDFSPYLYLDYVCQVRGIKNSKKNIEKVINDLQLQEVKDVRKEELE